MIDLFIYKFLFVLSSIYIVKYLLELIVRLFQDDVEPIKVSKVEGIFYYLAIAYIITFILIH
jgi:hypothetical protein